MKHMAMDPVSGEAMPYSRQNVLALYHLLTVYFI
jgi:hypothetical protein